MDNIKLAGINYISGHLEVEDEINVHLIAFHNDVVSKISWNKLTRSCKNSIFKIKTKAVNNGFSFGVIGEKYTINDELCQSFLLFNSSSEIILGVLLEDSIKFWSISHELSPVFSASFSDELGLLYLNSHSSSGFYTVVFRLEIFAFFIYFRLTRKYRKFYFSAKLNPFVRSSHSNPQMV